MATVQPRISPLPPEVISQIKSSTIITSLTEVVLGLLENSIDANSTRVEVLVDFTKGACTVEDDGHGIAPVEFAEDGGLGKMYCKETPQSLHGKNGAFLASLASLSLLTIISSHQSHSSLNSCLFHQSKILKRSIPAPALQALSFSRHGTRVVVHNLFGNMPVRVKQRASVTEDQAEAGRLWEALVHGVVARLLAWPKMLSVRIRNAGDSKGNLAVTTQKSSTLVDGHAQSTQKRLSQELQATLSILTQAHHISPKSWDSWVPASASTLSVSIKGIISLNPAPTRRTQFICLGVRPLTAENGHNELYDEINRIFQQSDFGSEEDAPEVDEVETIRRNNDCRYKQDGPTRRQMQATSKGLDRWPMFVLKVRFKEGFSGMDERSLASGRALQKVIEVINAMIYQWLHVHHFRPRKPRAKRKFDSRSSSRASSRCRPASTGAESAHKRQRVGSAVSTTALVGNDRNPLADTQAFSNWSRVKSGNENFYPSLWSASESKVKPQTAPGLLVAAHSTNEAQFPPDTPERPVVGRFEDEGSSTGRLVSPGVAYTSSVTGKDAAVPLTEGPISAFEWRSGDQMVQWDDPATKKTSMVDARTGIVLSNLARQPSQTIGSANAGPLQHNTSASIFDKPLRLSIKSKQQGEINPKQPRLTDALNGWDNPVFTPTESRIPKITLHLADTDSTEPLSERRCHTSRPDITQALEEASISSAKRISRGALRRAQVISQVDKKFILAKIDVSENDELVLVKEHAGTSSEVSSGRREHLVLIDQHAADERIQVEQLLDGFSKPMNPKCTEASFRSALGLASSIGTHKLEKTIIFQISQTEAELFKTHAEWFAGWGILYGLDYQSWKLSSEALSNEKENMPTDDARLVVQSLPPAIVERCRIDPKRLIKMLRSEVWERHNGAKGPSRCNTTTIRNKADKHMSFANSTFLQRLSDIPFGILELINSRACRSAIMFNDELTRAQCVELVKRLADCTFPFQCAHGRPSLVPLVELEMDDGSSIMERFIQSRRNASTYETQASFRDAWTVWKRKMSPHHSCS